MSGRTAGGRRLRADPTEFAPLGERFAYVAALRVGVVAAVVVTVAGRPGLSEPPTGNLVAVSLAYLILSILPELVKRHRRDLALQLMKALLLIDGIYITWMMSVTGGITSPLRVFLFLQVLVVTLLVAYRTGLKVAAWDSLLVLAVAMQAGSVQVGTGTAVLSAVPTLALLWAEVFITATFSAVSERELRRQKVDLGALANMGMRIEGSPAGEIPSILLETTQETFGFRRGIVLASPEGDLPMSAAVGPVPMGPVAPGLDRVVETSWASHEPQLIRHLDPSADPRLSALLPGARDVIVAPLSINQSYRLGVLVLEGAPDRRGMRRWELSLLMQFATHAALALNNAWLAETKAKQLEEIRVLQRDLQAQNARLELAVADRTSDLRRVVRDLEATDQQRRHLLTQVVRAQEDERKRIANDLHDDPLQKLVSMKMRLELLMRVVDHEDLLPLRDVTLSCIRSLRYLLFDLRPPVLDEEGVGPAVQRLLQHWAPDFEFLVRDELREAVGAETRVILYRIAQEALANVRKHASASHVEVVVLALDGGIALRVSDDGVGCDPTSALAARAGHLGLAAIVERAESAGGHCRLLSLPGAGTAFEAWLPLDQPSSEEDPAEPFAVSYHETA